MYTKSVVSGLLVFPLSRAFPLRPPRVERRRSTAGGGRANQVIPNHVYRAASSSESDFFVCVCVFERSKANKGGWLAAVQLFFVRRACARAVPGSSAPRPLGHTRARARAPQNRGARLGGVESADAKPKRGVAGRRRGGGGGSTKVGENHSLKPTGLTFKQRARPKITHKSMQTVSTTSTTMPAARMPLVEGEQRKAMPRHICEQHAAVVRASQAGRQ